MYVATKDLPSLFQCALDSVGYGSKDIEVVVRETISLQIGGGDGSRGFVVLLDLETDRTTVTRGSWGGSNMFNPTNVVDLDDRSHTLPENGAVIKGSEGSKVFATLYVHPKNVLPCLTAGESLDLRQQKILYCFKSLKSGPYRKEALNRLETTEADIEALVTGGYLTKNKVGIKITTLGKNHAHPTGY